MATIIITSKDANLFTMQVGVIATDKTRTYRAKETTGGKIRAENQNNEASDLFNPIHYSEIQIDGVVYNSANECVSALNSVIYNNSLENNNGSNNTGFLKVYLPNGKSAIGGCEFYDIIYEASGMYVGKKLVFKSEDRKHKYSVTINKGVNNLRIPLSSGIAELAHSRDTFMRVFSEFGFYTEIKVMQCLR